MAIRFNKPDSEVVVEVTDSSGMVLNIHRDGGFEWGRDGQNRLIEMGKAGDHVAHALWIMYDGAPIDFLRNLMADEGTGVKYITFRTPKGNALFFAIRDDAFEMLESLLPVLSPQDKSARAEVEAMMQYLILVRKHDQESQPQEGSESSAAQQRPQESPDSTAANQAEGNGRGDLRGLADSQG